MDLVCVSESYLVIEVVDDASLKHHCDDLLQSLLAVVVRDPVVQLARLHMQQEQLGCTGRAFLHLQSLLVNVDGFQDFRLQRLFGVLFEQTPVEVPPFKARIEFKELQNFAHPFLRVEQLVDVRVEWEEPMSHDTTQLDS